jgi:SAM-dependent methyltransferase
MTAPLAVYGATLRRAAAGLPAVLDLVDATGRTRQRLDAVHWCGALSPGDAGLVTRCAGPTLDAGCGPGRLTAALTAAGLPALGVDISAEAVRQARRRGAAALRRCFFGPLPGEGRWHHVLLADGNIGIGGDPAGLLARCHTLLVPGGDVLIEVDPPGAGSWRGAVAARAEGRTSAPFAWAAVSVDDLATLAAHAAMRVVETWTEAQRWFARVLKP